MIAFFIVPLLIVLFLLVITVLRFFNKKQFERAIELINKGDYEAAIHALREIQKKSPENRVLNWYLGVCYEKLGKLDLALSEYNKVASGLRFDPPLNEETVHERIAILSFKLGNITRALKEFQIVSQINEKNADSLYYQGLIYKKKGELRKSQEVLEKAIAIRDDFYQAKLELGIVNYELKHFDAARRILSDVIKKQPDNFDAHYYYALSLEETRMYDRAIEEFGIASQAVNFRFQCYVHIANIYLSIGKREEAHQYFDRAIQTGRGEPLAILDVKYRYANSLITTGEIEKALKLWKEIKEVMPGYLDVDQKISIYSEIIRSDALTKFMVTNKMDFLELGKKISRAIGVEVERNTVLKDDFLEFVGGYKIGNDEIPCIVNIVKWTNPVGDIPVRELLERMSEEGVSKGIFVSPSSFTEKAEELSRIRPIDLISRKELEGILKRIFTSK